MNTMKDLYTLEQLDNRVETELFVQRLAFIPLCFASAFFGAFVMLVLMLCGIL